MGKERLFRVLVIAISLKGNKIANFDDEIAESQFAAPIDELVKGGYIEEVTEDSKDEIAESQNDDLGQESNEEVIQEDEPVEETELVEEENLTDLGDISNSVPGGKPKGSKK